MIMQCFVNPTMNAWPEPWKPEKKVRTGMNSKFANKSRNYIFSNIYLAFGSFVGDHNLHRSFQGQVGNLASFVSYQRG